MKNCIHIIRTLKVIAQSYNIQRCSKEDKANMPRNYYSTFITRCQVCVFLSSTQLLCTIFWLLPITFLFSYVVRLMKHFHILQKPIYRYNSLCTLHYYAQDISNWSIKIQKTCTAKNFKYTQNFLIEWQNY